MSKDLSTQLPKPPELQPISSTRGKPRQLFSSVLMIAGVVLIGWGSWLFTQQQLEAHKPPPARILEVSVDNIIEQAPTLPPPAQAIPTLASQDKVEEQAKVDAPLNRALDTVPTAAPTFTSTPANTATMAPAAISEARLMTIPSPTVITASATVTPTATATPLPTATIITAEVPSLADNPLVVVEEATPAAPVTTDTENAIHTPTPEALPLARIVAESIELDTQVVEVGWRQVVQNGVTANVWIVADYAAGWHNNSALPGQGGNIVLSGHHNINGEVFRYIVDLEPGAIVTLYDTAGQAHAYAIVDKFIVKDKDEPDAVRRENAKWIGPFNEERLTLITCWPYTTNTHRVIVIGKPAGSVQVPNQ